MTESDIQQLVHFVRSARRAREYAKIVDARAAAALLEYARDVEGYARQLLADAVANAEASPSDGGASYWRQQSNALLQLVTGAESSDGKFARVAAAECLLLADQLTGWK